MFHFTEILTQMPKLPTHNLLTDKNLNNFFRVAAMLFH